MAIRLEYSLTAKCRPEHVWQKFQKLEEWPWWNRVIGQARWISGPPWQKGSRFHMELVYPRKAKLDVVIVEAAPPGRIAWVGKGIGFKGEHWFSFEPQADGSTLIKTWEDFSGILATFFGGTLKQAALASYKDWLQALKTEAEKIARDEHARS
jgi:hypothetical protein